MSILAIDGGGNIGYSLHTSTGEELVRGVIRQEDFFDFEKRPFKTFGQYKGLTFNGFDIDVLVVEGIRHNPNINQGGSQRWESQVEGACRMLAALSGVRLVVQPPSILPVAMKLTGYEKPLTASGNPKHLPDQDAAWLHAQYFLVAEGVLA